MKNFKGGPVMIWYDDKEVWKEALKEILAGIFLAAVLIGFVIFTFAVTP